MQNISYHSVVTIHAQHPGKVYMRQRWSRRTEQFGRIVYGSADMPVAQNFPKVSVTSMRVAEHHASEERRVFLLESRETLHNCMGFVQK